MLKILLFVVFWGVSSCATAPPRDAGNLCLTFNGQAGWYGAARQAASKWTVPVWVLMAIMHQESHFVADAQPPREWLLGFIPWFRPSSAYGFAQAKDETWDDYQNAAGSRWSDRDDFADAADFIGWYCYQSHAKLGIATGDAKNLYLAYHEGWRGFQQQSHRRKSWLIKVAEKVASRAKQFQWQLQQCPLVN